MSNRQPVLLDTDLSLPLFYRGKVRDTFELNDLMLIVATDRISAFDVVLPTGIPGKGPVLNQLSAFWFEMTRDRLPNHLVTVVNNTSDLDFYLSPPHRSSYPPYLVSRSMVVRKAERLPVECVVRGYLAGSAWSEYQRDGTVSGIKLPRGLKQSQELPEPLFTPTTKADNGHDEPMSREDMERMVGAALADELTEKSLAIYRFAREYALKRDIIIADTKMEFGLDNGKLILIDELLTPDSSRFWDTAHYQVGRSQPSYDKQPVRDWLIQTGWDMRPPAPELPPEVVEDTTRRYEHAYVRLTSRNLP